ncbi:TRAP transporter small permease [Bacillus canaveralius]|uniref:TRAP transporter small permease n=1 Tax=Bacillus canaveralius TaxID=1403243 RepID=UPI000F76CA04|nr:TRAP transporter small permease [Bacillus canaveralius]RSK55158.1 TRAP transporter small permease [Bacillus canaveralius]
MKQFIGVMDKVNSGILTILSVIFGLLGLLTLYQVFARYILKAPLVWSEEVIRYLMIWIVMLGTAIVLRKGLLISVETVLHMVPIKVKKALEIIIILVNIVFLFILIRYGFSIMEVLNSQKAGALDIPVAWTYAAVPVGAVLAIINCIVVLLEVIFNLKKEENPDGSAPIL